jgi:transposase
VRDDFIAVALGLPELKVLRQKEMVDRFEVTVRYRRDEVNCPGCGKVTNKEHDRRQQRKKDRGLRDKAVILILIKRRFRCCCCGKVFAEPDEVFGTRKRTSRRFREYLGQEALYQTVRRVAQREGVGEGLVRRCVAEQIGRVLEARGMGKTPELIGLDEFSVRKRQLYHTAICDLENREVMEVVEGQGKQKVEEYLSKLAEPEKVKAVAMDMHEPFRQAVQECLPRAKVVADKFHVVRHINEALDKVRSRHQGSNAKGKRKELFYSRYTLLRVLRSLLIARGPEHGVVSPIRPGPRRHLQH